MVTPPRLEGYWTKVLCAVFAASLAGCAGGLSQPQNTPPIEPLMVPDGGGGIEVARGRKVTVRLEANRSTGHRWLLATSGNVLEQLGEPFYAAEKNAMGAGGAEYWSFMPVKSGTQELKFEYRRPWEKDKPAAREVSYKISVR